MAETYQTTEMGNSVI